MKNIINILTITAILFLYACNDRTKEIMLIKTSNPFNFRIDEYTHPFNPSKDSLMIINYKFSDTTNSTDFDVRKRLAYNFFLLTTKIDALERYIKSKTKKEIVYSIINIFNCLNSHISYQKFII
jgi:hypothetical protein